jgi:hypothetical protein
MAESAELVVSKHSVWTPEKKDFTFMGHTVEGDLANLMQFAELVARAEREKVQGRIDTLHAMYELASKQRDALMDEQRAQVAAMRGRMQ